MFSIICSQWESFTTNPSVAFSMLCTTYSYASGMIPEYAITDAILSIWNLYHAFVVVANLTAPDAPYKKSILSLHHKIAKAMSNIPFPVAGLFVGLILTTVQLSWNAYNNPQDTSITFRAVIALHTLVSSIVLQKQTTALLKLGVDHTMKMEQELEKSDIRAWTAPGDWFSSLFAPLNWILRPEFTGTENVPTDYPGLYVMNHALYGMEAIPFVANTYHTKKVFMRGLADNMLFVPGMGNFIRYCGGVNGTRDNVDVLMEQKDNVLVYPGGGHEVMKSCAVPNYTLMWKQRLGFARVAIKHGYPIIPCASVGTEDMMDRICDINLEFVRKDLKAPVVVVQPHKLQKVYYWFGEPIPTSQYNGDWKNDDFAKEVRDKAKASIEAGIKELQQQQANDPNRFLVNHIANSMVDFCKSPFASSVEASSESKKKLD